jgi:hypothetical protein
MTASETSRNPFDAIWTAFIWRTIAAGIVATLVLFVLRRALLKIGIAPLGVVALVAIIHLAVGLTISYLCLRAALRLEYSEFRIVIEPKTGGQTSEAQFKL